MIELSNDDIIEAIGFYLEARGASADLGTLVFHIQIDGMDGHATVNAQLEGELEEADQPQVYSPGQRPGERLAPHLKHSKMAAALVQKDSVDAFTNEALPRGTEVIWFEGLGITAALPGKWPEKVRNEFDLSQADVRSIIQWLNTSQEQQAAADVLGGDGTVTDRGGAFGKSGG